MKPAKLYSRKYGDLTLSTIAATLDMPSGEYIFFQEISESHA